MYKITATCSLHSLCNWSHKEKHGSKVFLSLPQVQTHSNVMLRLQYLGTNSHLKRGKKEGRKHRVKQQKEGETNGEGGQGRGRGGEKEEDMTSTEVVVLQQHCSRPVYKGTHRPGGESKLYTHQ